MKRDRLKRLIFMALCCDLGIFAKKLIAPAVNVLTDSLHVPGGIGTALSLMFLVIGAFYIPRFGAATLMGAVQSGIALAMGTVGSMGALAPVGYIVPALCIDLVLLLRRKLSRAECLLLANSMAAVAAALVSNLIVFRLQGSLLGLYLCVAALSGSICGLLAEAICDRLEPVMGGKRQNAKRSIKYMVRTDGR